MCILSTLGQWVLDHYMWADSMCKIVEYENSTDVDIAPASGKVNGAQELGWRQQIIVHAEQSHWSIKCRSRASRHSVCLKGILKTITMQSLTLATITAAVKQTLMLVLT